MEKGVSHIYEIIKKTGNSSSSSEVKTEGEVINGINVSRIYSRDAYSYALQLMEILFTKEEMAVSLLFKSRKSAKSGLDKQRVEKMLSLIEKRYGNTSWDLKTLTSKVNQKCRDAKPPETSPPPEEHNE